jgi:hypothetical protein
VRTQHDVLRLSHAQILSQGLRKRLMMLESLPPVQWGWYPRHVPT